MVISRRVPLFIASLSVLAGAATPLFAQDGDTGVIRGVVNDRDFDGPLPLAQVQVIETGRKVTANEMGDFTLAELKPGTYTLVFSKSGYQRQVRRVAVSADRIEEIDVFLNGDFTDLEPFVVEEIPLSRGSEAGLLDLRLESPALLDSISAELLGQAGASDAAAALNLIAGATVQDGKYATVRGLPDRYVSTLLNGVRLPTADEDKRAVQLDLFPTAVIESVRVSKTFTPDQQGDASGGSVDIVLKGIPDENIFQFKSELKWNSQVRDRDDFLTYQGGGVNRWGNETGSRAIPPLKSPDAVPGDPLYGVYDYDGQPIGVSTGNAPQMYKWSADLGGRHEFDSGVVIGGFATFFYERDASYFDNGVDDSYWVTTPGGTELTPETGGADGSSVGPGNDFNTGLYDITEGVESVQWGGLATGGIQWEAWGRHEIDAAYLYTRTTDDAATLAEDTRGKQWFTETFYDVPYELDDPDNPGNIRENQLAAPYLRTQTLNYTERTVESTQFSGDHAWDASYLDIGIDDVIQFTGIEFDWTGSFGRATQYEPDKRQFGSKWSPGYTLELVPGFPQFDLPVSSFYSPFKPDANFTIGNLQHIYKNIDETSRQLSLNLTLPFEQWTGDGGYVKLGSFIDNVKRTYDQETFANFADNATYPENPLGPIGGPAIPGPGFDDFWSDVYPFQDGHPITDGGDSNPDVDYVGDQRIAATYAMIDLPLISGINVIGGYRWESTDISIVNDPEPGATWFPAGSLTPVALGPGDADVDYSQKDGLPAIALVVQPIDALTIRGSYTRTVARQTFKELSPILQQEFLGGPIFIGNPSLTMSEVENLDLRVDFTPFEGGLFSVSQFQKNLTDPIQYVQRGTPAFSFTTPENYDSGLIEGFELEARQNFGAIDESLRAFTIGGNAAFIESTVNLPQADIDRFASPQILQPATTEAMAGAPDMLLNLYLTIDIEETGTRFGAFYTMQGDTLVAGAGVSSDNNYIPSIYAMPVNTLNLTFSQEFFDNFTFFVKAKNLLNPDIQTVYRMPDGAETLHTSYSAGVDLSIGVTASFTF